MTRRFPPGAVGLPSRRTHYERVLQLISQSKSLTQEAFWQACKAFIRDPDEGSVYSDSWIDRLTSDLESSGFVRHDKDDETTLVTLWPTGERYLNGEIGFPEFIFKSLKRGWVLEGNAPEKIEALERVLAVLIDAERPLGKPDLRDRLESDHDYSFSSLGVRGYPELLVLLGVVERTGNEYTITRGADRLRGSLREADLFRIFERWMRREGPTGKLPRGVIKRDMSKYYMYRESEGWGKQTSWLDSFRTDYLAQRALDGETSRPELTRAQKYVDAENERDTLRDKIEDIEGIERSQLAGLSTDVLRRIHDAETARESRRILATAGSGMARSDLELLRDTTRPSYTFADGFTLYDWQQQAVDDWFIDGASPAESGIAQVVTGAGKTVMALEVIREWLEADPDGVVTVVVPTKVLMNQWLVEFVEKLNVPVEDIGWAGDGTRDSFESGCRILVSIINTAVMDDYLRETLRATGTPPHLLVADECHRYTSDVFSNIFEYPRTASLGLSATPLSTLVTQAAEESEQNQHGVQADGTRTARQQRSGTQQPPGAPGAGEDTEEHVEETSVADIELTPEDELLLSELGDIYYTLTYDEALSRGLIPRFEVNYVRFELTTAERNQYETLTRKISDAISDIEARYGDQLYRLSGHYAQKLNTIMNSAKGPVPAIGDYFQYTQERRELVANAVARQAITHDLLESAVEAKEKSIVFQERIEQLEQLVAPHDRRGVSSKTGEVGGEVTSRRELYTRYPALKDVDLEVEALFDKGSFWPVMYHSGHSRARWNDFAMEWFREDGFANVMLSVKALIEGVDVPSADVGIIRVSSSSLRQRIQTLGRVLRTGGDASKHSKMYVLYAADTVDERLFEEYDWSEQLANAEINHLEWVLKEDSVLNGDLEATDAPLPSGQRETPTVPDPDGLERGDPYSGPRDGWRFSVDSDGRPFKNRENRRQYISTPLIEDVARYVYDLKGGGTVVINEANHMVTQTADGPIFLGVSPDPDSFEYEADSGRLTGEAPDSLDEFM